MKFNFLKLYKPDIIRSKKNFKRKELKLACNVELGDVFCCMQVSLQNGKEDRKKYLHICTAI